MCLKLLNFIKLDSDYDRICFIFIVTAQWWENCLCGNKYCVIHTVSVNWNSACLHLQTDYGTFH